MKSQMTFFKWLAVAVASAMLLNIALTISPAQAQSHLPSVINEPVSSGQRGETPLLTENPPVMFVENVGQFNPEIRFQVNSANTTIFLTQEAIWVTFLKSPQHDPKKELDAVDLLSWKLANLPHERVNLKIFFPGANPQARLEPFEKLDTQISNLIGNDPSVWKTNVPVWKAVRYVNIYPGADLVISSQNGRLDWYFDVRDSSEFFAREGHIFKQGLQVKLAGQKGLRLSEGSLLVETELGNFPLPSFRVNGLANPKLRQNSPRLETDGLWLIEPGDAASGQSQSSFRSVSFRGPESFLMESRVVPSNPEPLVSTLQSGAQDRLLYATLLGGSSGWETGEGIAVDGDGNIYVTGYTDSPDFPAYAGYDQSYAGTGDVFIVKLDPNTGQITYATFLGGNLVEFGSSIAVDQNGAAYVTGCTESPDFPTRNAYDSIFHGPTHNPGIHTCSDAFLTKLNPQGNDLEYSTFIGGNGNDDIVSSVIDSSGNVYFIGYTESSELYGVPISNKYFTGKINVDGSAPAYIKSLANRANGVAVGSNGFAHIVGTSGTPPNYASYDVTVISLDQNGETIYSTTFGGSNRDRGWGIAVDNDGFVSITGDTNSTTDFPRTAEALRNQTNGGDAFVTRLDPSGAIVYSTFLGGDTGDSAMSIAIDSQGVLYVVGSTMGINFINPDDSIKSDPAGWDYDVFAVALVPVSATKYTMRYGTYVGGSGWDFSYATVGTVDENGNVYITGETDSTDFVGTSGVAEGDTQAFVVKIATGGTGYECSPATLSAIGQAVLAQVGTDQNYCLNKFEKLILIEDSSSGKNAFQDFADLASQAKYEVDFTTMIWNKDAGRIFISGVKELYEKVKSNSNDYPNDVRVRILLGLERYPDPGDQRNTVLRALDSLDVPLEDFGGKWGVEVATYRNSKTYWGFDQPNLHSHVKILIVDGQSAIVSGYNLQDLYIDPDSSVTDVGLKISGPIVQDSLAMFDDLWQDARGRKCVYGFNCEYTTAPLQHAPEVLLIQPNASNPINVFSLFRNETLKTADNATTEAIRASSTNINLLQNRYFENYPPRCFWIGDWCIENWEPDSFPGGEHGPFPYTQAIIDAAQKGVRIKMLLSSAEKRMNSDSIENLRTQILLLPNGSNIFSNITVKFSNGPLHAKALSIDGQFVVIGSQNFDYSAFGIDPDNIMDLVEYSFGVDNRNVTNKFDNDFASLWDSARAYVRVDDSIQQAVDQAPPGTIIYVPAGIYHESVTINKPVALIGDPDNLSVVEAITGPFAIQVTSSDVSISRLTIRRSNGYGIALTDISPSSLKDIFISDVVFDNNALGGILVQSLISGSPVQYTIENNTIVGGQSGITLNLLETQQNISSIRNNIFIAQTTAPIYVLSANDGGIEYSYNSFSICGLGGDCTSEWHIGNLATESNAHDNLFNLDPQFLDPIFGDYRLAPTSPLIDSGDPDTIIIDEYRGSGLRIDIGAFESFLTPEQLPPLPDDMPNIPGLVSATSPNNVNLRRYLNPSGDEDWFRFRLTQKGSPQIHLTSLPTNYDLYVYNSAGQLIGSSKKDKKAAELVILVNAAPGNYYVRVIGVGGAWDANNPYQLRFNVLGTGGP